MFVFLALLARQITVLLLTINAKVHFFLFYPVHFILFYTYQLFLFDFFFQLRAMKLSEEKMRNESEKKISV